MECKDYIGKLVYEQFKRIEGKYAVLEKRNAELSAENDKLLKTLEKVTDMVTARISKTDGEIYISSFWNHSATILLDLLGIDPKEEEEEEEEA